MSIPTAEIQFAAKAGFLSKPIWKEFFADGRDRWQRRRWQLLSERGIFLRHPSRLPRDVLILNPKSPIVKSIVGDAISAHPFIPQIEHDESAAKILLTLAKHPKVLNHMFEAEMKRQHWVENPFQLRNSKTKFPDGVIEVESPGGIVRIALEVEISRKDQRRYRQILTSYAARKDLAKVLFLARSKSIFDNLKSAMHEVVYPDWERPVGFGDLNEWLKDPIQAPIYLSEGVSSIDKISARSKS